MQEQHRPEPESIAPAEFSRDDESTDPAWQRAGGAPQARDLSEQISSQAETQVAHQQPEDASTQGAELPRDVESNDPAWQRTGGASSEES